MGMTVLEFKNRLHTITVRDLNSIHEKIYMIRDVEGAPRWDTGATKSEHIQNFTRWVRGNPARVSLVLDLVDEKRAQKEAYPTRGPVPHTRYITFKEIEVLPSYPHIAEAVEFRYDPASGPKHRPITKDGYLSVHAIYNMSAWANWKSSSLSEHERRKAEAIQGLGLYNLMDLNHGRRMDQPALFPVGILR